MASVGFMLRFVNWTEVYEKYKNGAYTQPGVLSSSVVTVRMTSIKEEKLSSNPNDDKYQIHTRDGTEINIFTTGCVLFKGVKEAQIDCACCHHSLPVDRKENTPIPKTMTHSYKLVKVDGVFVKRLFIDCFKERVCCDFECAVYAAKRHYGPEVEEYVRILHRMMHPKAGHLREAPNPDLLIHNGGSMTYEEYKKDVKETYVPLVGLNFTPVKQSIALI